MSLRSALFAAAVIVGCTAAGPRVASVPPSADADVALRDGRTLHVRELPLGRLDGVVLDGARYDRSGTRIALLATFPNGAIDGDWHRARPTQAFVADLARRTLTAVTSDGRARSVRWIDALHVRVDDGGIAEDVSVSAPLHVRPAMRVSAIVPSTSGQLVSPASEFRLQVLKTSDGSYAVGQVGAVRLRTIGVAPGSGSMLAGSSVVWIDATMDGGSPFSRAGPDDVLPMSFPGTRYGTELTHVLPLGHLAYQGAYRNGVAYFAFTLGLQRIVAATTDFTTYVYPALPAQPDFTIGDGLGAGADGVLYFADPENRVVQTWQHGRYVERTMTFPDGVSDVRRLYGAMAALSPLSKLEPPMRPDADALDNALLEWRMYPIGDVTGSGWIASYLGQPYVANADLHFRAVVPPRFPFAVLSRTDDGRVWGASPFSRQPLSTKYGSVFVGHEVSLLYSTRDGLSWSLAGSFTGGIGAIGLRDGDVWLAMSAFESDAAGVEIARVVDVHTADALPGAGTGAVYAGEDLFFADLNGGFYLVCGGEPGTRLDDGSGPLVALEPDTAAIFRNGPGGVLAVEPSENPYVRERYQPQPSAENSDSSLDAIFMPSELALQGAHASEPFGTIVTQPGPAQLHCCRTMTPNGEREFELEYAWTPYPLARIDVQTSGDTATVRRTLERGPLAIDGQLERWTKNARGTWELAAVLRRWHI